VTRAGALNVEAPALVFNAWPRQAALTRRGAPGRFGTNDPKTLLARHGWEAEATHPGGEEANYGLLSIPMTPRRVPGLP
jgi:hypothetical protein